MSVSLRRRWRILERDSFTCGYCGRSAPDVRLEVDHIEPVSVGGSDHPSNLITACWDCNHGKAARDAREPLDVLARLVQLDSEAEQFFDMATELRRTLRDMDFELQAAESKINHLVDVIESLQRGYKSEPTHIAALLGRPN